MELPCDITILLLGVYLEKMKALSKSYMHSNIHSGNIYNNQNMDST